ncbi:MAG: hypothetical protein GXP44_03150 [bacterium]|nr:hypothetical protein [bacterium]
MEKTSFIPKKSFIKPIYKSRNFGILMNSSIVLFAVSMLVFGGVYLYKKSLDKSVVSLADSLERARDAFDLPVLAEIGKTAEKIEFAKKLLENHIAPSPIFSFLEQATLENVRFSDFSYTRQESKAKGKNKKKSVEISMNGLAKSYASLALQADEFQKNKNVENISVSNLSLGKGGVIKFRIVIALNPNLVKYGI